MAVHFFVEVGKGALLGTINGRLLKKPKQGAVYGTVSSTVEQTAIKAVEAAAFLTGLFLGLGVSYLMKESHEIEGDRVSSQALTGRFPEIWVFLAYPVIKVLGLVIGTGAANQIHEGGRLEISHVLKLEGLRIAEEFFFYSLIK